MPAPDYAAISADPRRLLDWLGGNLLMAGTLENTGNPRGLAACTFDAAAAIDARNEAGHAIDAYWLRSHSVVAGAALDAYICNYNAGQVTDVQLQAAAAFCFTINLNGCTFGVGQPAADGTVRVSHANAGGRGQEQRDQTFQLHGGHRNLSAMLEPAFYRRLSPALRLQATVVGLREAGVWRFYFQLYSAGAGGDRSLIGVFPFPS